MSSRTNPKVYMDIQIGASGAGRVIFQLFNDLTPKTVQNFRGLCTGEYGKAGNVKLSYLNAKFHRIIDGFVVQGGDITHGGGNGGFSIYGRTFADQNFARTHSCAGLLSMANSGRNTNSSQFFITLKPCPHLDGKHVVFGQVIDGMEVVKKMSKVAIDMKDKPKVPIIIIDCGQIGDFKDFIKFDPFQKSVFEEIKEKKRRLIDDRRQMVKLLSANLSADQAYQFKKRIEKCEKQIIEIQKNEQRMERQQNEEKQKKQQQAVEKGQEGVKVIQAQISNNLRQKIGEVNTNRLLDLKLKINAAKVANSKAALSEQIRQNDVNYHKMIKKKQWLQKNKMGQQELAAKGLSSQKFYLNRNALKKQSEQKINESFGWNVFSSHAYYKAYQKRCESLKKDPQIYQQITKGTLVNYVPSEEKLKLLSDVVVKQIQKRQNFSRRRMVDQDQKVSYINERNRHFNMKVDRAFKAYASSSKTAMEMNSQKQ